MNAKITNKFEEKIIEFEEISKELNKTVKKLDILEDVSVSIQSIASDIPSLSLNNEEIELARIKLDNHLKDLKKYDESLDLKISDFNKKNTNLQEKNESLKGLTEDMNEYVHSMQNDLSHMNENLADLDDYIATIKSFAPDLESLRVKLNKLSDAIDAVNKEDSPAEEDVLCRQ